MDKEVALLLQDRSKKDRSKKDLHHVNRDCCVAQHGDY